MDILDFINSYWRIVAFIGVVIMSWVRYEGKVNALETKDHEQERAIEALKTEMKANDKVIQTLKVDLAEIKTILQFLKEKFDK